MKLVNDNQLYAVDSRFLGPKGWSLPWAARYSAYYIGGVIFLALTVVEHRVGVPFSPFSIIVGLALTVGATTLLHRRIDAERPLRTVWQSFVCDVTVRRAPKPVCVRVHTPRRVR